MKETKQFIEDGIEGENSSLKRTFDEACGGCEYSVEEAANKILDNHITDNITLEGLIKALTQAETRGEMRGAEKEMNRCTDIIADQCSFVMENSKSREIVDFASSLANKLYSSITSPKGDINR